MDEPVRQARLACRTVTLPLSARNSFEARCFVSESKLWPSELRVSPDKKTLTVSFEGGVSHAFTAEMLRVMSPSAEVQGHSPEQRVTVPNKANVAIKQLQPVGNYAIRIVFDDGHDSGLFT